MICTLINLVPVTAAMLLGPAISVMAHRMSARAAASAALHRPGMMLGHAALMQALDLAPPPAA